MTMKILTDKEEDWFDEKKNPGEDVDAIVRGDMGRNKFSPDFKSSGLEEPAEQNDSVDENIASNVDHSESANNSIPFDDYDSWKEWMGINKVPERTPITDEQRERALERQNELSALGNVLLLLAEGAGASQGMYVDKRKPNPYMERTWRKLQELKDRGLYEKQRTARDNMLSELRNINLYGRSKISDMNNESLNQRNRERITSDQIIADKKAKALAEEKERQREFTSEESEKDRNSGSKRYTKEYLDHKLENSKELEEFKHKNRLELEAERSQNRQSMKQLTNELISKTKGFTVDWNGESRTLSKEEMTHIVNRAIDDDYVEVFKMFQGMPKSTNDIHRVVEKYYPNYLDNNFDPETNIWEEENQNENDVPIMFQ